MTVNTPSKPPKGAGFYICVFRTDPPEIVRPERKTLPYFRRVRATSPAVPAAKAKSRGK